MGTVLASPRHIAKATSEVSVLFNAFPQKKIDVEIGNEERTYSHTMKAPECWGKAWHSSHAASLCDTIH